MREDSRCVLRYLYGLVRKNPWITYHDSLPAYRLVATRGTKLFVSNRWTNETKPSSCLSHVVSVSFFTVARFFVNSTSSRSRPNCRARHRTRATRGYARSYKSPITAKTASRRVADDFSSSFRCSSSLERSLFPSLDKSRFTSRRECLDAKLQLLATLDARPLALQCKNRRLGSLELVADQLTGIISR